MRLENAKEFRIILVEDDSILYNYYSYVHRNDLPYCYVVRSLEEHSMATVLKDGKGEIIIQPETIARMLHELSEANFNNYINVLIHEYYGRTR